jgi:hypothetical protein
MPCYTPPESHNEEESRKVSKLILIFDKKIGIESDPRIQKWADAYYENHCDTVTPMLCEKINSLSKEELEKIVYNGRDKESRMLADWFDEHDKFDKERGEI